MSRPSGPNITMGNRNSREKTRNELKKPGLRERFLNYVDGNPPSQKKRERVHRKDREISEDRGRGKYSQDVEPRRKNSSLADPSPEKADRKPPSHTGQATFSQELPRLPIAESYSRTNVFQPEEPMTSPARDTIPRKPIQSDDRSFSRDAILDAGPQVPPRPQPLSVNLPPKETLSQSTETQINGEKSRHFVYDRVDALILKVRAKFPHLPSDDIVSKLSTVKNAEFALKCMIEELETISRAIAEAQRNNTAFMHENNDLRKNLQDANLKVAEHFGFIGARNGEILKLESRLKTITDDHLASRKRATDELSKEVSRLTDILDLSNSKHTKDMQESVLQHEKEMRKLTDRQDLKLISRLDAAWGEWAKERDALQDKLDKTTNEMTLIDTKHKKDLDTKLNTLRQELEKAESHRVATEIQEYEAMRSGLSQQLSEKDLLISRQDATHRREVETLESSFRLQMEEKNHIITRMEQTLKEINDTHERENERIRKLRNDEIEKAVAAQKQTTESLTKALVQRDGFKATSDYELAFLFQAINSEVDEFSRLAWDSNLQSSWPFKEQVLQKTGYQRRTKQYVLQNNIWTVLYSRIFWSPFCVLGDEGTSLEVAWSQQFGQDAKFKRPFPHPSKEAEKWRYDYIRMAVEATVSSLRPGQAGYSTKIGYEQCLQDTSSDIIQELTQVTRVSELQKGRVFELVTKAAKLWLEVGQQRCRMFLMMSDTGEEPMKSNADSLKADGSFYLVVSPELRRMGNAMGEKLDIEEIVAGCRGDFSRFQVR